MKVLIIGVGGFVGKNLYEFFIDKGYDVVGVGRKELNLLDQVQVYDFFSHNYFDVVIDAAIYNPRILKDGEPEREVEYDLRMFYNLERCCKFFGKMFYFGSGAEYDKRFSIESVLEDDVNSIPASSYGLAKYIIGKAIEASENIYNLRIFGLFGKYENWKTTFISGACCKAIKSLPITIRQDVFFDYLYISDFCNMVEKMMLKDTYNYHTYNITSGKRIRLSEIAQIVNDISKKNVQVIICKDGMANEYTSSNKRLLEEIGDYNLIDMREAISDLYSWYIQKQEDIDLLSLLY